MASKHDRDDKERQAVVNLRKIHLGHPASWAAVTEDCR